MAEDLSESGEKSIKFFSALKSAADVQFFLIAMGFTLLVDDAFVQFGRRGLLTLASGSGHTLEVNLVIVMMLIILAYSIFVSVILGPAAQFVDQILFNIYQTIIFPPLNWLHRLLGNENFGIKEYLRKDGFVFPGELKVAVRKSKDVNLESRLKAYYEDFHSQGKTRRERAQFSLFCLAMLIWNRELEIFGGESLIAGANSYLDSQAPFWGMFILFFSFIWRRIRHAGEPTQIYCPALYHEVIERQKNERLEREAFEDDLRSRIRESSEKEEALRPKSNSSRPKYDHNDE